MKLFLDTEFTGLHQNTTLISIALVAETGEQFYIELDDYDESQVDDWILENVIKKLMYKSKRHKIGSHEDGSVYGRLTKIGLEFHISQYLDLLKQKYNVDKFEIWSDCLAYDWVLFCEIFGGAMNLPECVYYIPFDICTLFQIKGVDPDISRKDYSGFDGDNHNALSDAMMIKACYEKLTKRNIIKEILDVNFKKEPEKPREFKSSSTIAKEFKEKQEYAAKFRSPSDTYRKVKESIKQKPEWKSYLGE